MAGLHTALQCHIDWEFSMASNRHIRMQRTLPLMITKTTIRQCTSMTVLDMYMTILSEQDVITGDGCMALPWRGVGVVSKVPNADVDFLNSLVH